MIAESLQILRCYSEIHFDLKPFQTSNYLYSIIRAFELKIEVEAFDLFRESRKFAILQIEQPDVFAIQ